MELNDGYREILDAIASESPTPGGGSVAALSLAHAHALVCMVSRLTLKSKKWESGHDAAELALESSLVGISVAIDLSHMDAASFDNVIQAFKMPKSTDDEIIIRRHAITEGYLNASHVPLETAKQGIMVLTTINRIAATCNANAITDLVAAAHMAQNAVIIAGLNVRVNLASLGREESELLATNIDNHERTAVRLTDEISEMVGGRM